MSEIFKGKLSIYKIISYSIIAFFIFKCCYFSFNLKVGVLPDEISHLQVIEAFYNSNSFSVDPVQLGPSNAAGISQDKFLYHLLMGKLAKVFQISIENISFFRAWNILFSTLCLIVFYFLTQLVFKRQSLRVLSLVIFSNILMFTATSSSISYDPLTNLISILIIYLLFSYLNQKSYAKIYSIGMLIILGTYVKTSILPLLPIIGLVSLVNFKGISPHIKGIVSIDHVKKNKFALLVFLLSLILSVSIASKNYESYGRIFSINCTHIFNPESCNENDPLSEWYSSLRAKNDGVDRLNLLSYYDSWNDYMIKYTFGIAAHEFMLLDEIEYKIIKFLLILSLLGWPFCLKNKYFRDSLIIFLSYFFILLIYVNYKSYMTHGDIGAGIHGRYIFPVLSVGAIVLVQSLEALSQKIKSPLILPFLAATIFLYLDFPSYLQDENLSNFKNTIYHKSASSLLKLGEQAGAKIHVDYIGDQLVNTTERAIQVTDDFKIRGWAFDERDSQVAQEIVFNLNGGSYKKAVYELSRDDVAKAYDIPAIAKCGFLIHISYEELVTDTTTIHLFLQYEKEHLYNNYEEILIIK